MMIQNNNILSKFVFFFPLHKEATVSCRLMGMNKLISNLNSTSYNKKLLYFQLKKNLFR